MDAAGLARTAESLKNIASQLDSAAARQRALFATIAVTAFMLVGCAAPEASNPEVANQDTPQSSESSPDHDSAYNCPTDTAADGQQEDTTAEPDVVSCSPGPDEDAGDDLVIDHVTVSAHAGDWALEAQVSVTNQSDQTQVMIDPTSVRPRVDEVDGVRRLTFARISFAHDDDGISNPRPNTRNPGPPHDVTIAPGETLTLNEPLMVSAPQIDDTMRLCIEVLEPPRSGSPGAQRPTGDASLMMPNDIGFAADSTLPLICAANIDADS